ncbi:MAG TPA: diguanylate cyclase [Candidatus Omnitrophota bacterium]|nr:diguanylate cyclase [Candidatus Omnitrophota bacterium]
MAVEKSREVLRLLERLAVEHLGWLMRVHSALIFPDRAEAPPCAPDSPLPGLCAEACGQTDQLSGLLRQRAIMHGLAQQLLEQRAKGADPAAYQAFMAAVDAYVREARRVEAHFRRELIETDPLTGVHNRQGMMREIRREWTRAMRTGRPVCVAVADLDFFKHVNDTYGHLAGDKVLCLAARFFVRRLRPYDQVFRYGGEEFLFCLPDTDADTARAVLDRLRGLMARVPVVLDCGTRVPVTCSIGVAQMVPGRSVQEAIAAADRALYAAKDAGRNRVMVAAPPADAASPAPEVIAARLHPVGAVRH